MELTERVAHQEGEVLPGWAEPQSPARLFACAHAGKQGGCDQAHYLAGASQREGSATAAASVGSEGFGEGGGGGSLSALIPNACATVWGEGGFLSTPPKIYGDPNDEVAGGGGDAGQRQHHQQTNLERHHSTVRQWVGGRQQFDKRRFFIFRWKRSAIFKQRKRNIIIRIIVITFRRWRCAPDHCSQNCGAPAGRAHILAAGCRDAGEGRARVPTRIPNQSVSDLMAVLAPKKGGQVVYALVLEQDPNLLPTCPIKGVDMKHTKFGGGARFTTLWCVGCSLQVHF